MNSTMVSSVMSSAPVRHTSSTIPIEQLPTLVHVLAARAEERGDKILYTYLEDGRKHSTISYAQLDSAARAVASALSQCASRGDRALLLYPPGIEFAKAFFGCLYAGIIAVPAYPPDPARLDRSLPRLRSIMRDADATIVLTTKFLTSLAASMLNDVPDLASLRWIATDTVPQDEGTDWEMQPIGEDTLAFLQYTSGSTGNPKGVMVTHRNLAENERMIKRATRQTEDSIMAGWLPIFHDMGLVGQLLEPLFTGGSCVLMSPIEFLQKPISWLRTISEFDVTIAGGPNFAYDLCVRKATEQDKRTLDLSRWVVAFNGAEPIRKDTIDRFVEAFAPCGFRREAFLPCYGLAEATLYVTGAAFGPSSVAVRADRLAAHQVLDAIPEAAAQLLVSSGESPSELQVLIVDPARLERCPSDQVGEIWVAGPSVARGYWNKSAETERIFHAHLATGEGPFLRTGDLGFLRRGQLMITGRMKDLIVLHGRNHYPHDLEATMEAAHVAVRTGCTAAFSVDIANEERLVLVAEVDTRRAPTLEVVVAAISTLIAQRHGIHAHSVVLIEPRTIYKTSSGKLQRFECKNAFLRGALTVLHKSHGIALATADGRGPEARPHRAEVTPPESPVNAEVKTASASPSSGTEQEARPTRSSEEIETWIRDWLAEHLECSSESIDRDTPLESFGLDSVDEVLLIGELRDWLGDKVTPTEAYQYPTVRRFSSYLSSKCDALASRSPTKHLIDSTSRIERW